MTNLPSLWEGLGVDRMQIQHDVEAHIDCLSPAGNKVAVLRITPASDASTITLDPSTETTPQLHENGRYWCELIACNVKDAHLQCSLSTPAHRRNTKHG